jgi:membrane protein YqaA with SNARE-associated domain
VPVRASSTPVESNSYVTAVMFASSAMSNTVQPVVPSPDLRMMVVLRVSPTLRVPVWRPVL